MQFELVISIHGILR